MNITLYQGYAGQPDYKCSFYNKSAFLAHLNTLQQINCTLQNVYSRFEGNVSITYSEINTFYPNYMVEWDENGNYIRSYFITRCDKINNSLVITYTIDIWISYLPDFLTNDTYTQPWRFLDAYRTRGTKGSEGIATELLENPIYGKLHIANDSLTVSNGIEYYIFVEGYTYTASTAGASEKTKTTEYLFNYRVRNGSTYTDTFKLFNNAEVHTSILFALQNLFNNQDKKLSDTANTYLHISKAFVVQKRNYYNFPIMRSATNIEIWNVSNDYGILNAFQFGISASQIEAQNYYAIPIYTTTQTIFAGGDDVNCFFGTIRHKIPISNPSGEELQISVLANVNRFAMFISGGGNLFEVTEDFEVTPSYTPESDLVFEQRATSYRNNQIDNAFQLATGAIKSVGNLASGNIQGALGGASGVADTAFTMGYAAYRFENDSIYPTATDSSGNSYSVPILGIGMFTAKALNKDSVLRIITEFGYRTFYKDTTYPKKLENNSKSVFLMYDNLILAGKIPNQHLETIKNILENGIRLWCDSTLGMTI